VTTILVVDDYPVTRRILGYTLRKHGYEVVSASDGEEALARLSEMPVDMAIVDIAMPGMDGISLLKLIRADPQLRDLPVVMLSASGQDQDRITAREEGANAFLSKPSSSHELLDSVRRFTT
jgi:CheY-like chemotaxis protein